MARGLDFKVLGIPEMERTFKRMPAKIQKKAVRPALRASAKRIKAHVIMNISGVKVNVQTGTLLRAFSEAPVRSASKRDFIRIGIAFPEREYLNIPPDEKSYYPTAVEYGHGTVPPHPYMRPAVDEHKTTEFQLIGQAIGKGIEKQAGK